MLASSHGHKDAARVLIAANADVDAADEKGVTPLMLASRDGLEEMAQLLLESSRGGASEVDAQNDHGQTPLIAAVTYGHNGTARLLLNPPMVQAADGTSRPQWTRANIELASKDGRNPIHRAAEFGLRSTVALLLDVRAQIDTGVSSSLSANAAPAAATAAAAAAAVTTAGGAAAAAPASVNLLTGGGALAPTRQRSSGLPEPVSSYTPIVANRGVHDQIGNDGATALSLAARNGHDDVVRLLLDRKASLEKARVDLTTPLMEAAAYNHAPAVRVLLAYGAAPGTQRKGGECALHRAAKYGHEACIRELLRSAQSRRGVGVGSGGSGGGGGGGGGGGWRSHGSPSMRKGMGAKGGTGFGLAPQRLSSTVLSSTTEIPLRRANALHEHQRLHELRDDLGRTALHRACENGHEPAARALLQAGADPSLTERDSGWSSLMLASAGGHEAVVRTLLRFAADEQGDAGEEKLADQVVERTRETALHLACARGHIMTCRRLLHAGRAASRDPRREVRAPRLDGPPRMPSFLPKLSATRPSLPPSHLHPLSLPPSCVQARDRHQRRPYDVAMLNRQHRIRRVFEPTASDEDVTDGATEQSALLRAAHAGDAHSVKKLLAYTRNTDAAHGPRERSSETSCKATVAPALADEPSGVLRATDGRQS